MKLRMPGATAIAAALVAMAAPATLALAPAAFAQKAPAPPPGATILPKQMVGPMNEALTAIHAKDFATAKAKLDLAESFAKAPAEIVQVERLRLPIAVETGDAAQQLKSLNVLINSGLAAPEDVRLYKGAMGQAYAKLGDAANALKFDRAFLDEYGGSPEQIISLADRYSKANDLPTSMIYAEKAIAGAKAKGETPPEVWYRLQMRNIITTEDWDKYYPLMAQLMTDYPKVEYRMDPWARAQEAPNYIESRMQLDLFRGLIAAGLPLNDRQVSSAADDAISRGLPNEALQLLTAADEQVKLTSEFDKGNFATAKSQVKSDKAGLAKETEQVIAKGDAIKIAGIGEAHMSYGDNAKAIEVLNVALAKGIADPNEAAIAKLHLGIAQYRNGDVPGAQATWAGIKSDNGAMELAKAWIMLSKMKA